MLLQMSQKKEKSYLVWVCYAIWNASDVYLFLKCLGRFQISVDDPLIIGAGYFQLALITFWLYPSNVLILGISSSYMNLHIEISVPFYANIAQNCCCILHLNVKRQYQKYWVKLSFEILHKQNLSEKSYTFENCLGMNQGEHTDRT